MIVFPSMIAEAAERAGMKVPPNVDNVNFEPDSCKEEYPHFFAYCCLQLCRPIIWGNHWQNAEIIAKVPEDKLKTMTEQDFRNLGFDP